MQGSTNSLPTPMKCKNCIFRGVHNLSAKKALKLNFFVCFLLSSKKYQNCMSGKKRGKKIVTNLKSSRMKTASMFAVHIFAIIGLCLSSGLGYKYSNKEEPLRGIHSSEISMIFCLLDFTWNHFLVTFDSSRPKNCKRGACSSHSVKSISRKI